ncbi:MAG: carboxymethylenebutenolidase [Chloroflexota bacterium]|jgi:carboxymethylenebutenolidase|nr:carboxymethylenebutenolidase [Chloroflexota bacterium]
MTQVAYQGAITSTVRFGDRVDGFLAIPEQGTGPFGAVILGHERYGLVQHTLDLTAKFARYGYVAIAPDMFSRWGGDKAALNRGDISVPLSDDDLRSYMSDSLDYLLDHPQVKPDRIAAMGVCQSGSYPLQLNSVRPEIAANIVMYGGAQKGEWQLSERRSEPYEDALSRLTAPILGIFGEKDFIISVEDVFHLATVLMEKRKSFDITIFPDMPHGWLNDTMPGRYRPKEAEAAWNLVIRFLERLDAGELASDRVFWKLQSEISPDYDFTKNVRLA